MLEKLKECMKTLNSLPSIEYDNVFMFSRLMSDKKLKKIISSNYPSYTEEEKEKLFHQVRKEAEQGRKYDQEVLDSLNEETKNEN